MLQIESCIKVSDNTGASIAKCIRALQGFNRSYAYVGDYAIISIQKLRLIKKIKKGEIYTSLIIRTKKSSRFKDGSFSSFGNNSTILVNKKKRVLGNRLFGFVSRKLRKKKFIRVMLMAHNRLI